MAGLPNKLQLKSEHTILLITVPESISMALREESFAYTQMNEPPTHGEYGVVILFVKSKEELEHYILKAKDILKPTTMLWVSYPKKSSVMKSDLSRDNVWQILIDFGYTGVRQVAINETWSSLKFKHKSLNKSSSMFGVDMPGIDRKLKLVTIPDDMELVLKQEGVKEVFDKLAFTHRKEFVLAVLEAKRPETRAKRIQKAIEEVKQKIRGI